MTNPVIPAIYFNDGIGFLFFPKKKLSQLLVFPQDPALILQIFEKHAVK